LLSFQRAFEQELGIVEDPEACTDIREQPHALDVMRHFLKKLSAEFFRFDQFALRDKVEHGQQRLRQSPQRFELRRDLCGLLFEAFSAKYLQLPPPARNQRGIDPAGTGVGEQGIVGAPHIAVSVCLFLVSTAVFGRDGLEIPDVPERRLEFVRVATAYGSHVERIGILGLGLEYCGKVGQCVVETLRNDLLLDRTKIRNRTDCLHGLFHHEQRRLREGGAKSYWLCAGGWIRNSGLP
jgi:hypothetical protein